MLPNNHEMTEIYNLDWWWTFPNLALICYHIST